MSSVTSSDIDTPNVTRWSRWAAYWELTKPRIACMVLVSIVAAGFIASPVDSFLEPQADLRSVSVLTLFNVAVGMFLIAASGNASNMFLERYTDFLMPRTAKRPLPDQRLSASDVANFAAVTFGIGLGYLLLTTNWATTLCAVSTWVLYVWVYTPLKRVTWLNTEVGAIAGALPVACGALAANGRLEANSWGLFLTLLLWQFPHFMAIAWMYRDQYAQGGMKMLTVTEPTGRAAGRKAIVTAVLTGLASLIPAVQLHSWWSNLIFVSVCTLLALGYLVSSVRFAQDRNQQSARSLLRVSIIYLPAYMLTLVIFSRF